MSVSPLFILSASLFLRSDTVNNAPSLDSLMMTAAALICAHIVTGSLVLGCASTINALTGANIIACNFLLPLGIAVYVLLGGLRATFLVDYLHTVILFISEPFRSHPVHLALALSLMFDYFSKVIYYFLFHTYGTSALIGSPGKLYDLLKDAAILVPVEGNHDGSYLTMKSNSGLLFAASTIATGFSVSLVHCDHLDAGLVDLVSVSSLVSLSQTSLES